MLESTKNKKPNPNPNPNPKPKPKAASEKTSASKLLLAVAVAHGLAMLFICYQAAQWSGALVTERDGTPRFAYQDARGKYASVPIEAGSLLRIALALESVTGTGPVTTTGNKAALEAIAKSATTTTPAMAGGR